MSTIKKTSMLAALCVGLFASSSYAQDTMTATIGFPFVANGHAFPAGEYEIRNADVGGDTLLIQGRDNTSSAFVPTMPADGHDPVQDQPTFVFEQIGTQFQLTEVWASSDSGRAVEGARARHTDAGNLDSDSSPLTRFITGHRK